MTKTYRCMYNGHILFVEYKAFTDGKRYDGSCIGFIGKKTKEYVSTLPDDEYEKALDFVEDYGYKHNNFPY